MAKDFPSKQPKPQNGEAQSRAPKDQGGEPVTGFVQAPTNEGECCNFSTPQGVPANKRTIR